MLPFSIEGGFQPTHQLTGSHWRKVVQIVRDNVTIDWTLRDNVQAKLRIMVKHILKKYGYPPDKQQKATDTVLDQAKLLCKDWAETQN